MKRPRLLPLPLGLAAALMASHAAAQPTAGRLDGSQGGAPPPHLTAPPPRSAAAAAPRVEPPAAPVPPPPPPPPAQPAAHPLQPPHLTSTLGLPPPQVPAERPANGPAQRVRVNTLPRGLPALGEPLTRTRERTPTEAERRAATPTWSAQTERGPLRWGYGAVAGSLVMLIGLAFTFAATQPGRRGARRSAHLPGASPPRPLSGPPADHPGVELRSLSIAFDAGARASLQQRLAALGAQVDPNTPPGLFALAGAVRDLLASAHGAVRMGAFQSFGCDPSMTRSRLQQLTDRARGRYTVETIANARRVVPPALPARADEANGLAVVTLLVASRGPLPELPPTMDLPSLMHALHQSIPARADRLLALEVIWSPPDDTVGMSSAELAVLYPELLTLDPRASLGRHVCQHCRAVYARELGRCPACGDV